MNESLSETATQTESLLAAYRHDAHKLTREPHSTASETFEGVPVNQTVPHGADADAAALSRPSGSPTQTVETHSTHERLSLLDTEPRNTVDGQSLSAALPELLTADDPDNMHHTWLTSAVAREFNESVYYPYTSLKYHTLLVAALLDNYRAGQEFADLLLVVDPPDKCVPHRTIFTSDQFSLRLDTASAGRPTASLGDYPSQSWARTWRRLSSHPLETDHDKFDMVLDANLRRITSWSTALAYIEDALEEWR